MISSVWEVLTLVPGGSAAFYFYLRRQQVMLLVNTASSREEELIKSSHVIFGGKMKYENLNICSPPWQYETSLHCACVWGFLPSAQEMTNKTFFYQLQIFCRSRRWSVLLWHYWSMWSWAGRPMETLWMTGLCIILHHAFSNTIFFCEIACQVSLDLIGFNKFWSFF